LTLAQVLPAGHLLIHTDGSSRWIRQLKSTDNRVTGLDDSSGETVDIPRDQVAAAIPIAQRGAAYSPGEISNVMARISQMQSRFPKLKKQLNQLKQEWEPFLKTDDSLAPAIETAAARYRASPRSGPDWKAVQSALEMVRYRDARGEFKSRIDALLSDFRADCIASNQARLAERAAQPNPRLQTFFEARDIRDLLIDLQGRETPVGDVTRLFEQCRSNVFQSVARQALSDFKARPSLDNYLTQVALLYALKSDVAPHAAAQRQVEQEIAKWQDFLQKKNPGLSFDASGIPLNDDHRRLLDSARSKMPRFIMRDADGPDDGLLLPLTIPSGLARNQPSDWNFKVLFRCSPPPNRRHILALVLHPESGPQAFRRYLELPDLTASPTPPDRTVTLDLRAIARDFRPARQDDGRIYLIVYLAELPADQPLNEVDESRVVPLSKGWGIPLRD